MEEEEIVLSQGHRLEKPMEKPVFPRNSYFLLRSITSCSSLVHWMSDSNQLPQLCDYDVSSVGALHNSQQAFELDGRNKWWNDSRFKLEGPGSKVWLVLKKYSLDLASNLDFRKVWTKALFHSKGELWVRFRINQARAHKARLVSVTAFPSCVGVSSSQSLHFLPRLFFGRKKRLKENALVTHIYLRQAWTFKSWFFCLNRDIRN